MAKIQIEKPHTMAVSEVKTTIDGLLGRMESMGIKLEWNGDNLQLSGKGVKGQVAVSPDKVSINLDLGMPASLMKGKIEQKIRDGLEKHLKA
jgi:putative polyhydroxyalkanoate system protein